MKVFWRAIGTSLEGNITVKLPNGQYGFIKVFGEHQLEPFTFETQKEVEDFLRGNYEGITFIEEVEYTI